MGSRLVLGTANFGLKYGINNRYKKLSEQQIHSIIQVSSDAGVSTFDTAEVYGDSEERLGKFLPTKSKVISKISFENEKHQKNSIFKKVKGSIEKLQVDSLYGVLIHQPEKLLGSAGHEIVQELRSLKQKKIVEKIGFSIYGPEPLRQVTNIFVPDIIQVPFNIFDQRFHTSGWAKRLKGMGVEIHIRSAFLQGLLLMKKNELPAYFQSTWPEVFERWTAYQLELGRCPDMIALGFCLQQKWADKIVCGVDNFNQLRRLIEIERNQSKNPYSGFKIEDENLLDPSKWKFI